MREDGQKHLYQHFKKEESTFIDKVLEWKRRVEDTYVFIETPFLTPRERLIASQLFSNQDDVGIFFWGGYESAERQKGIIAIANQDVPTDMWDMTYFEVHYPKKFATLKHSHILGSLLGLGIQRDTVGDIITDGTRWQLVVSKTISGYIQQELKKIGAITVRLETIPSQELVTPMEQYHSKPDVIASLRIDTVVASGFNISRAKAKELVEQGLVSVNWKVEMKSTCDIAEKDIISVRGYGRLNVDTISGTTKSGKWKVHFLVLKNRK